MCGLHHQESYPDDVEIGWRFASQFWGSGYATEAAQGWLEYGFSTLGLPRIISMTDPENERSIAVMKRLGLTYDHEAEITDDEIAFHAVIYTITASQWANDNGRAHMEESPS